MLSMRGEMRSRLVVMAFCLVIVACGGSSVPIRVNQPLGAPPPGATIQSLYEAGRDDEVISRTAGTGIRSEDVWFAAQSLLRMGQRGEAGEQFRRLRDSAETDAFKRAAEVAIARLSGQPDVVQVAQTASGEFPNDPYVQF